MGRLFAVVLLCLVVALSARPGGAAADRGSARVGDRRLPTQSIPGPRRATETRGTAYIFIATDCPIANRYAPEIQRLAKLYRTQGVQFRLVYVNPRDSEASTRDHARRFGYDLDSTQDPTHALVKRFGISVTPEAALVDSRGAVVYRGRIDDRYAAVGVDRQHASRRELQDALQAVVDGRTPPVASAPAVGCYVSDLRPVTFAADIAPVLFDKCSSCHRPGGPAPFSLLTYDEARQRASLLADVTERRFMPPYQAHSSVATFVGQKRLGDDEIALFRRWVDEGAPEGDRRQTPAPPRHAGGWQLGVPDLVVTPLQTFTLPATDTDAFRIFVIRLPVATTRYVTGIEFHPGNARVVHHANIRIDRSAASRELDGRDPAPGYDGLLARSAVYPEGHFLGWTPGQVAPLVADDLAWRLDPGTDLVVQLHMQPSGAPEQVRPEIGFFFSDRPPSRTPTVLRLGSQGIEIPAGESAYRIGDAYVLPVDVELHAVQPHAHYRLREVRGTATLPDGTIHTLIDIVNWDFRWQHVYRYTRPIALPKGTRVAMAYRYDNSAENPRNPQVPPRQVSWGQRSFDEMGDLWFQFVAASDADRVALTQEIAAKMTAEDVVGYETMLRATPDDAELHDDVGVLYLSMNRGEEAVRHFAASAALKPTDPSAQFNLGTALSVAGRLEEAVTAYRAALVQRPAYGAAHNNLGSVLAAQGRSAEAIEHFRAAVAADRRNVQALRNLAWHLAQQPQRGPGEAREAVDAGRAAATLTGERDPYVLEALIAAYRAAGMTAEAAVTEARVRRLRP